MRFILHLLLIVVIAAIAAFVLPWWAAAIVCFAVGFFTGMRPGKAFLAGFLAIGLLWLGIVLWADIPNEHILSGKMAALFHLPGFIWFIITTVVTGALVGGLSAWSGALGKKAFLPDR